MNTDQSDTWKSHLRSGRPDKALDALQKKLDLEPGNGLIANDMGVVLGMLRQYGEALRYFRLSTRLSPDHIHSHRNAGEACNAIGRYREAVSFFRSVLDLAPDDQGALLGISFSYIKLRRFTAASGTINRVLELDPSQASGWNLLALVQLVYWEFDASLVSFRKALSLRPSNDVRSAMIFSMNYLPAITQKEIFDASRMWAEAIDTPSLSLAKPREKPARGRRLRVGYVSSDFRRHPVGQFFLSLIGAHDSRVVESFCYSSSSRVDDVTQRIKGLADHFLPVIELDDAVLAERIAKDRLDVLVDMGGHTAGSRLNVFRHRLAPVQISWLGSPNTSGLSTIDYWMTDNIANPMDADDTRYFSEALYRLDGPSLCYRPLEDTPAVSSLPALKNGYVTFGSCNNSRKINPLVIEAWVTILRTLPDARLILKDGSFGDLFVRTRTLRQFTSRGIPAERVELRRHTPGKDQHLATYDDIDIALDTFPYNGVTTTGDALWMGVPVVALAGERYISRMAASILSHAGYDDLVADSAEAYVEVACGLASNLDRLADSRAGMRAQLESSPLCDAGRFARSVEQAYIRMLGTP